ncbi:hypothetical protein HY492_03325 [Candidatus Woesearchaeota archaeon]|nr:hypothetical protein [Candidatus Woesearchaeota archaeon]
MEGGTLTQFTFADGRSALFNTRDGTYVEIQKDSSIDLYSSSGFKVDSYSAAFLNERGISTNLELKEYAQAAFAFRQYGVNIRYATKEPSGAWFYEGTPGADSMRLTKTGTDSTLEKGKFKDGKLDKEQTYEITDVKDGVVTKTVRSTNLLGEATTITTTYGEKVWNIKYTSVNLVTTSYDLNTFKQGETQWVQVAENSDYYVDKDGNFAKKDGEKAVLLNSDEEKKAKDLYEKESKDAIKSAFKEQARSQVSELAQLKTYWLEIIRKGAEGWGALGFIGSALAIAGELLKGYQQYQGIASLGGLFMKDQVGAWREKIDNAFCKAMLGADCIAQKLCEKYGDSANSDIVITTTYPGTGIRAAAHIQAERSQPSFYSDETGTHQQYLYRVTFFAASPREDNGVQITFHSSGGQYDWYPEPQEISEGGVVSAQGPAAIVKYSTKNYDRVCLTFQNPIDTGTGGKERQLCVPIVTSGVKPSGENAPPAVEGTSAASEETTEDVSEDAPVEEVPEEPAQPGDGF